MATLGKVTQKIAGEILRSGEGKTNAYLATAEKGKSVLAPLNGKGSTTTGHNLLKGKFTPGIPESTPQSFKTKS